MFGKFVSSFFSNVVILLFISTIKTHAQEPGWEGLLPSITKEFSFIAEKFNNYDVVLKPDKDAPEWWAGAPSVIQDDQGIFIHGGTQNGCGLMVSCGFMLRYLMKIIHMK